ncbi:hypothetical protein [Mesobacillus jeotgali]|uniref:hypothetical protein n=1 Tax=Mesobacillus jeotgali TaxID=129985 RepID=UPI0017829908|nr:hypothetical protein [Mesobacillus jeotgali]UYZ21809.1 hypothetical protein FOF60_22935 [Mesobacillus jeotgali]
MKNYLFIAFLTVSTLLAAKPGVLNQPSNSNDYYNEKEFIHQINLTNPPNEDLLISDIQFAHLEELKSSSTGLIRMSYPNQEDKVDSDFGKTVIENLIESSFTIDSGEGESFEDDHVYNDLNMLTITVSHYSY